MITIVSSFASSISKAHQVFVRFVSSHPILLIPLSAAYASLTLIAGIISIMLAIGVGTLFFTPGSETAYIVVNFFFHVFFVLLAPVVWIHYLFLSFRCFTSATLLRGYAASVFRVVQLVAATVFIFAVVHYYVALFSDSPAYEGLHKPVPEYGWSPYTGLIDRLTFVPPAETVIDCIYFSAATMATVGYGDIHPVSALAKIVTVIQIIFSFGLIVVVLGWMLGHANEYE